MVTIGVGYVDADLAKYFTESFDVDGHKARLYRTRSGYRLMAGSLESAVRVAKYLYRQYEASRDPRNFERQGVYV